MEKNFFKGMKVSLLNEFGVVLNKATENNLYGFIRWDTKEEDDIEDWRGLFGSFLQIGGESLIRIINLNLLTTMAQPKEKIVL